MRWRAYPDARFALVGKTGGDARSSPASTRRCSHHADLDAFDLAAGRAARDRAGLRRLPRARTPGSASPRWPSARRGWRISGGRWFEYYFNHVPFRSVIPDVERYPCFSQFAPAATIDDGEDGPRTPSMSRARFRDDLGAIVAAAGELLAGTLTYEQALRDYFAALLAAHGGDAAADLVDRRRAPLRTLDQARRGRRRRR